MSLFLQDKLNIPSIVSYTTRKMRNGETQGVEHLFIDEDQVPNKKEMLAYTFYGDHHYFATHSQVPKNGICSYVIDEKGLEELTRRHCNKYTVIAVNVVCDPSTLVKRGIDPARILRDRDRRKLHEQFYDCIIHNDGTLEEFEQEIINKINNI